MTNIKVRLLNGKYIPQSEIDTIESQKELRAIYNSEKKNIALCCCSKNYLELVIAHITDSDKFILRRIPNQLPSLHDENCKFRKTSEKEMSVKGDGAKELKCELIDRKGYYLKERGNNNLDKILETIWELTESDVSEKASAIHWATIKKAIDARKNELTVNGVKGYLRDKLSVILPTKYDSRIELKVESEISRLLIAEVYQGRLLNNGDVAVHIKGSTDTLWLGLTKKQNINEECVNLLLQEKPNERIIVMAMVIASPSGTSIQIYDATCIRIGADDFKRIGSVC